MAELAGTEIDAVATYCDHGCQTKKAVAQFYNIDDPPSAEDQIAMFPDQAYRQKNLVYVLMKMGGLTGYTPIVFCADCAAPKFVQYCNNVGWVYQYKPCPVDKDFYCPKFYAELMRRLWMYHTDNDPDFWKNCLPPISVRRVHVDGCLHSGRPDLIIQRKDGLADSIYFRHCGGEFRDLMMQKLELKIGEDAAIPSTSKWRGPAHFVGAHMVPGLEWKDKTAAQNMLICESIVRL